MQQFTKPSRPGKIFLDRYTGLAKRLDALTRQLEAARDRSTLAAVRMKPIHVQGGPSAYDAIAQDVATIVDAERQISADIDVLNKALYEIREAINAIPAAWWRKDAYGNTRQIDGEMVKAVLTIRYIEGVRNWDIVAERMGYSKRQTLRLHGYGIEQVEKIKGLTQKKSQTVWYGTEWH